MIEQSDIDGARDHAWRYFDLHAGQRMSLFNFYLVLSGLVLAGMAAIYVNKYLAPLGAVLGLLLALVAFVFWKLDQRVSFLMKRAERALGELESSYPPIARLFDSEPKSTDHAQSSDGVWTYGRCFRVLFAVTATVGLLSMAYWTLQGLGCVP